MFAVMRHAGLAAAAGLMGLAGAGIPAAGQSVHAAPAACAGSWSYLTAIRVGEHETFDRVVFQFTGKVPVYTVERVDGIYNDPRGYRIPVAGQRFLRIIFDRASAFCGQPSHKTYRGPAVLSPYGQELLMVSAAGDFAGVLAFGVGRADGGGYTAFALSNPSRVVLDLRHGALGRFPGIWGITSWRAYWAAQYAWLTGHRRWLSDPARVVRAWALSRYGIAPALRKVNANTIRFALPGGATVTITGIRPVNVPGPWVITRIICTTQ